MVRLIYLNIIRFDVSVADAGAVEGADGLEEAECKALHLVFFEFFVLAQNILQILVGDVLHEHINHVLVDVELVGLGDVGRLDDGCVEEGAAHHRQEFFVGSGNELHCILLMLEALLPAKPDDSMSALAEFRAEHVLFMKVPRLDAQLLVVERAAAGLRVAEFNGGDVRLPNDGCLGFSNRRLGILRESVLRVQKTLHVLHALLELAEGLLALNHNEIL